MQMMETFGHFIIYEEINSGGAAVIYRVKNKTTGRQAALKVLHQHLSRQPEYRKRIQREVKFISGVDHPNLVKVYSSGEIEGKIYIEMEYFKSRTLHSLVQKKGRMKIREFYSISTQIAEGLSALHKKNILHRDLSFENILINDKDKVKITDFGLIKVLPENTQFSKITQLTAAGNTFGTLHFMSPEQLDGQEMGKESDIFSFGVNLYYMLTGKLPFEGKTGAAIISSITRKEPDSIIQLNREVSFDLQSLVFNLLSKNPNNRIKGIHQISRMLSLLAEKEKISVKFRPMIIRPWLIYGSGLLLIIISLLLSLTFGRQTDDRKKNIPATEKKKRPDSTVVSIQTKKNVMTSYPLDEYLNYNFSAYKINDMSVEGFAPEDERLIKYEFLRIITLIKGKDIFFDDGRSVGASENICEIKYTLIKEKSQLRLIEEWNSILVNEPYRKEVKLDVKADENLAVTARNLFLGSSLLRTSLILFEREKN
jgi:serine/threonine protein kinase